MPGGYGVLCKVNDCPLWIQGSDYCYCYPYHNWSSRASPIDMWEHHLVITVPADGPPNGGAKPSVGTMMTIKLDLIYFNLCLFDDYFNQSYILQIRLHYIKLD